MSISGAEPEIRTEFPRDVRVVENVWIPLGDGCRLAARIWLPIDADQNQVPAILEYIPYRKDDLTASRDAVRHRYFAGHGYASVRVDLRGSGDSDGILHDEYLPIEQDDALEVLAWLAAQPWCTGAVGMIGISWGGFNGLQVAARRPPELKAVISLCSTDDRYADDVHYMGGCVLGSNMLNWASTMLVRNALPPLPSVAGDRWRAMWLERMEQSPPFVEAWLSHQRRDGFWKHGSVRERYADIACAVYAIGGWADGYSNAIPRLLEGLPGPRKGLIGPWAHMYPESGKPGPAIGFLQECLRWWDYWLKGIDTGIMDEPMLRAWMQESQPPSVSREEWPGRWVAEPDWPSPTIAPRTFALNAGTLDDDAETEEELSIVGAQTAGRDAGAWCPHGLRGEYPADQRGEDGSSLCFTSAPLPEPLEFLGFPVVTLTLSADRANALVAVRLCDVAPTGESTLISYGLLNLTHRECHEFPEAVVPGERFTVTVRLNAIGWVLPAGHRLRVAVSPTFWPRAWPSPELVHLRVFTGGESRLVLPVRAPRAEDAALTPFAPPETAPPLPVKTLRPNSIVVTTRTDAIQGLLESIVRTDHGHRYLIGNGVDFESIATNTYAIVEGEPLSATARSDRMIAIGQGAMRARIETTSTMTSDANVFRITNLLTAYDGNVQIFNQARTFTVPRDFV
ncbi:MAG: CocE/NonD family hydrolase [Thermomicrobiales bacterium]